MFKLKNLKNPHTPVIPQTPNFYWDEVLQNNLESSKVSGDFNYIDHPGIMRNVIIQALMLQELREWYKKPIQINSWYRPREYNDIVLPDNGYHSSPTSDHLHINSSAVDAEIHYNDIERVAQKWKKICNKYDVSWSIGVYDWGLHLGWRRNKDNRIWGADWWQ